MTEIYKIFFYTWIALILTIMLTKIGVFWSLADISGKDRDKGSIG